MIAVDAAPLAVSQVSYSYASRARSAPVLHDVDLTVGVGEWVAVMGPSGSGKSTLLLCAAGLLRTSAGAVTLDGVDVGGASEAQLTRLRRDRVGFVFQEFNLVPALTAEQNVGLPARFGGIRRKRQEIHAVLDRVGMQPKARSRPDELSGGQRQRVAIARALVSRPAVVFAHEPTGSLDSKSADQVLELVHELVQQGTAVLMVTHDPRVAARADRIVWLRDGRIVDEMTAASTEDIAAHLASLEDAV
ncbi:ABC transporter ATP-binding protein [Gryllotalpicola reticulitermitis]|uniref:ABC transporter ATP-binding protein n=1 Tax=Gryllotalpicola reticulitermitis TaxID=1184153 RepID=A0ABV8Q8J7_9MICO